MTTETDISADSSGSDEEAPRQILTRFLGEEEARTVVFADGRADVFTESIH